MDSLNQIADIIVGHATVSAVIVSFLTFAVLGWARVPPLLAYALAFVLSFIYLAHSMHGEVPAVEKDMLAFHQAIAAVVYSIMLATVYWVARIKLNFKITAPPAKKSPKRR
jgi:hypothetical protein